MCGPLRGPYISSLESNLKKGRGRYNESTRYAGGRFHLPSLRIKT